MGKLTEMKQHYEEIPIPGELALRVQQEIAKSRNRQSQREFHRLRYARTMRAMGTAAAAVVLVFTMALNTVPAFAVEAARLPVIGGLARVLTFRAYETEQNDIAVSVEIPSIEMIAQDTGIRVDGINQEILDRCSRYVQQALARAAHNIKITVDYEILRQDDSYLSFAVRGSENWSGAGNETRYYNLDLTTGKEVTLQDLLGDDYENLANESIRGQIAERQQAGMVFFPEDAGGFSGISEDTQFYINANHNPVIVFAKYEIANGAAGEIEFEIGG